MEQQTIIDKTVDFVKQTLSDAEGGHDWWHIYRVWKNAQHIAKEEAGVNTLIVELGALLHDIADSKFHNGDEEIGPKTAREYLMSLGLSNDIIEHVENIVRHISFKGTIEGQKWMSPELAIVQDADRLDALGAIGIARTFNYGGHKGRLLYDPEIKPNLEMSKEEYKSSMAPTLNHFYEKLLLLKDLMNTKTGKAMAEGRHSFMEKYLEQFYGEWEGKQ
ncbi:phosphohydrolase [Candidatus Kaiserbacteria bacterium CG_4_9_14_0_2_um_filter_41_32]|uniref:Phosphohydrolase n=1 Tax=Candidatus Kaiserbacteria bacterium CG_4_9_14_0_2_um_filter_41_32 TaxID=1974601 RepID=A0A2M8FFA9_9BACT|nr:MAG: phosphohydrolase [Candidatus Kaiserbacteria bacterium CG_4_9_14_0_2_um_filter_41_32]